MSARHERRACSDLLLRGGGAKPLERCRRDRLRGQRRGLTPVARRSVRERPVLRRREGGGPRKERDVEQHQGAPRSRTAPAFHRLENGIRHRLEGSGGESSRRLRRSTLRPWNYGTCRRWTSSRETSGWRTPRRGRCSSRRPDRLSRARVKKCGPAPTQATWSSGSNWSLQPHVGPACGGRATPPGGGTPPNSALLPRGGEGRDGV